jgi:signal transduction histidine kinase/CheY-like chemotaxis protein
MSNLEQEKIFEIKQALTTISNKVAVPLYFLFWLLDLIYVPQYKWEFLGIRCLIIPTALILHWWLKYTNSVRQAEYAGLFLAFMCASILNVMVFIIGQGALYFIPLHLVAIGGLSFIPWSNRNFIIATLLIYAPYLIIEVSWLEHANSIAQFSVNGFFIFGVISVTWVIKSYREKLHNLELSMRLDLENEIDKRKQTEEELILARDSALAATRAKESFLANMSHEIRTPLTAIIGYADTGLDHDQTTQQRIAALKTIRRSGDHLLSLVNDILDFSKIEAGELQADKILINPLQQVSEVESLILGHASKKGLNVIIDYQFPLPKEINSDAVRIKQILLNLCNNAIKFTDAGEIRMTVQYDSNQHQMKFIVKDSGIGISHEKQEKIFQPFKQAESGISRRYGGTGLGLSLSRELAALLDGQLAVSSEIGKGSTFTFTLNLDEKCTKETFNNLDEVIFNKEDIYSNPVNHKQLRGEVLLVEDNATNQNLIKVYLERMGVTVSCAGNGATAVSMAQQHNYDLIFMDVQMPVMTGIEAVKILRNGKYKKPIVMLTANATYKDKTQCMEAGANDFVTKPIIRQKLYETTANYLELAVNTSYQEPIYSALLQEEPRFEDLLYNFMDSLRIMQQKIVETFKNNEFYAFAQVIHDLKGTAGGFGYPDLTKLAEKIENSIKDKDFQAIESMLGKLDTMCERIYQGAQHH